MKALRELPLSETSPTTESKVRKRVTENGMSKAGGSDSKNTLYCSFCGKSQHEVRMIASRVKFSARSSLRIC
jgi:hypothetical protein